MKKVSVFSCLLVGLAFFTGCNNQFDSVFSESADERVRKALDSYRTMLTSAPDGWKAALTTGNGHGYMFYFQFKEDGTVTMISDFNKTTAGKSMEGTFVMKGLQRPTLSFDTYSYVHMLADPDGSVNGGEFGEGLVSDFEFAFETTSEDTLNLIGIQRDTKITFVKASEQERLGFLAGDVKENMENASGYFTSTSYAFIQRPNQLMTLGANSTTKLFTIFYTDQNSNIQKISLPFTYSLNGITLHNIVAAADLTFQHIQWDEATSSFYILKGNEKVFLQNSTSPVLFTSVNPTLIRALGFQYDEIVIDTAVIKGNSARFMEVYSQSSENLYADFEAVLGKVTLSFDQSNNVVMTYDLVLGSNVFEANFSYTMNVSPSGAISFSLLEEDSNASVTRSALISIINYFENNSFSLDYVPNANMGIILAYARPLAVPTDHFYGMLLVEEE